MASYVLSIKPYAVPAKSKVVAVPWLLFLRRTSVRAGQQLQRFGRRISPWYDESEHGNRLVMWS
jgi:hypothetical protein